MLDIYSVKIKKYIINITLLVISFYMSHAFSKSDNKDYLLNRNAPSEIQRYEFEDEVNIPKVVLPIVPEELLNKVNPVDSLDFFIREIKIEGNTALSKKVLQELIDNYTNRFVTINDLHQLRYRLSKLYINRGYVNSGVVLPDQKIENQTINLTVIEGSLETVKIRGVQNLPDSYIRDRILMHISDPLNVENLKKSLQLLEQNPHITRINARLNAGSQSGDAILDLNIEESEPYIARLKFDNHSSPNTGSRHVSVDLENNNLLGKGDHLILGGSTTEGSDNFFLNYLFPTNANDANISFIYSEGTSEIIQDDYKRLGIDIDNNSQYFSVKHNYPILNEIHENFSLSYGLTRQKSKVKILDQVGFISGRQGGDNTTSLNVGAEWFKRSNRKIIAFRFGIRQGIDAISATNTLSNLPGGKYHAWVTQFQYLVSKNLFKREGNLQINIASQISFDPLLSQEKFSVGGSQSVRGYRENQLVKDNGLYLNIEYHVPLFQNGYGQSKYGLKLVTFYDFGKSWNNKVESISGDIVSDYTTVIKSIGVGLSFHPKKWIESQLFYGHALDDVSDSDKDALQDKGVHFSMLFKWKFH